MTKLKLLLVKATLIAMLFTTGFTFANITNGLVAYYPFNGNANDESGNGNNGTVNGATLVEDRFGNANSAYSFDGTNDYINIPQNTLFNFNTNSFTLLCWIKTDGQTNTASIIGKFCETGGWDPRWRVFMRENGEIGFHWSNAESKDRAIETTETFNDNKYHLVTVVINRDILTNYPYIYVDGKIKEVTKSGSSTSIDAIIGSLDNNEPIKIGQDNVYDMPFKGIIDDVRIYNRVLTQTEIQDFYGFAEMCYIPAGSFQMGDTFNEGNSDELPVHDVYISSFYMDKYEVSNEKIREVMQWAYDNGKITASASTVRNIEGDQQELLDLDSSDCQISFSGGTFYVDAGKTNYPCREITWYGSQAYCNYKSDMEGLGRCIDFSDWSCNWNANGYRLPTEAEWEKAARGGLVGKRYPWGDTIDHSMANYGSYNGGTTPCGYYDGNQTPAGSDMANGYGLYDMAGNVWEWNYDWNGDWYSHSESTNANTHGPASGTGRRIRGGRWSGSSTLVRCANRGDGAIGSSSVNIGFRCARNADNSIVTAPKNVLATDGLFSDKVKISWDENTNAVKYTVYRNTVDDSDSAADISGEITTNFYEDLTVKSNQLYFYWIKAGTAVGWSSFSSSDSGYAGSIIALPTLSPTLLNFSTNYITKFVTMGNSGSASYSFDVTVVNGSPWLEVSPIHGTVSVQNVSLAVTVDRSSLSAGSYEGYVDVIPSVGNAFTVTARVEVTVENAVVAEANGPYTINQGSEVSLTAVGSTGNSLLYKWEVGLDFSTSYTEENFDYTYTNTFIPGNYDVILYIRDTNSPPNTSSDSALLTVNNVSPNVDIGGPYIGKTGSNITFTAVVYDPGILDTHEYRWDFDGNETWDINWTNLSTVSYAYSAAGNYAAVCEVKDNHGGSGSDAASVLIEAENLPPVAQAVLQGTSLTVTNLPGLSYTVTLDGSGSSDPDTKPNSTLYFDWREDVNNPTKPVIVESNRHDQIITTSPLTEIGEYKFHLVVFDGEFNSEQATITVRVPGWGGQVICEGFSGNVPLWGVDVMVTNSFKGQLNSDRTDENGQFLVDTGTGYQIAKLSRRNNSETEIINIDNDGEYTENIYFLPTYYIYAGQVVTGTPGNFVGLPYVQTEILIGKGLSTKSDAAGAFGYGMVPENWPLDGEKFKVRFQKQGFKSMAREILMNMNKNSEFILLTPSFENAQVQGTVLSKISGLPVEGAEIDFGNGWTTTSDSNGNYGPIEVPEGDYIAELNKAGFDTTFQEILNLPAKTNNIDFIINGGEVSVYGQIIDGEGNPVTNALVELVDNQDNTKHFAASSDKWKLNGKEIPATGAGYYDVTIAKGKRTYIVSSPDFLPVEITLEVDGHTKQDIILPIPEPCLILNCSLLLMVYYLRKRG